MTTKICYVLFLLGGSLLAQSTSVFINDTNGNQTTGTISNGNVYFHDSHGNSAYGTIRGGSVFMNTGNGEITFGTLRDGNVFLTDSKGITTGTIKNGNIFLSNSDGSITTGTYNSNGQVFTSTSGQVSTSTSPSVQQQQINQQNYDAGAAFGRAIGSDIAAGVENHRINSYCKANPTSTVHLDNGVSIPCPDAPVDSWEQHQIDSYCAQNPGLWIEIGKHRANCDTAPNPPSLKWAIWELKEWQWDYKHQRNKVVMAGALTSDQLRTNWEQWRETYCALARSGAKYKDLNGKKQSCN